MVSAPSACTTCAAVATQKQRPSAQHLTPLHYTSGFIYPRHIYVTRRRVGRHQPYDLSSHAPHGRHILSCFGQLTIFAPHRAICRVESKYPDPETFNPARWLEPSYPTYQEPLSKYPNFRDSKYGMHSFGYGRRKCLGMDIVDIELFVTAASVLWAFNMSQAVDGVTGEKVSIDSYATNSHVILEPDPYQMQFDVRGARKRALVTANYAEVAPSLKLV